MAEVVEKGIDLLIEQLRKSGLNTLLLVIGIFYFGYRYDSNQNLIATENTRLKEEIKILDGTLIANQRIILANQDKMLSNQEKGLEILRYKSPNGRDETP